MKLNITLILFLLLSYVAVSNAQVNCSQVDFSKNVQQCQFSSYKQAYVLTNTPYALCSKTLCTFDEKKGYARCICPILNRYDDWKSISISPTNYQSSKPTYQKGVLQSVQSNFSLANINRESKNKKINLTCNYKDKQPWANCFGVRCSVLKKDASKALCRCPIEYSKSYVLDSYKSDLCNQNFNKNLWSAASINAAKEIVKLTFFRL